MSAEGIPTPQPPDVQSSEPQSMRTSQAGIVFLAVFAVLITGVVLDVDLTLTLLFCFMTSLAALRWAGFSFAKLEGFAYAGIHRGLEPIMIVAAVGVMLGAWIASGTVPTLTYFGLQAISPEYLIPVSMLLCGLVSIATGSSWASIGTAGVALIGVAHSVDAPLAITAGAILSGAFFGDKMSPFSETTVLAAGVSGADLMGHIRHMLWTTLPAFVIAGVLFTIIGLNSGGGGSVEQAEHMAAAIDDHFAVGLVPLIPAVIVIGLIVAQMPPFPSIFLGALAGCVVAVTYQGLSIQDALSAMYEGYVPSGDLGPLTTLLSQGGLVNMLSLIALFIFILGLSGMLINSGAAEGILGPLMHRVVTTARRLLCGTLVITFINAMIGASTTFACAVTGPFLGPFYRRFGLAPVNLSRAMEDSATMGGQLIPWNASVIYAAGVLGVSQYEFIPFIFVCILTPVFSLIYALTGFTIKQLNNTDNERQVDPADAEPTTS